MSENKTKSLKLQELVDFLREELKLPFFKNDDLKAAAALGLYYNSSSHYQSSELKTKSLIKKMRVWMKQMNANTLLKILNECNSVITKGESKKGKQIGYGTLRIFVEEFWKRANWDTHSDELSLAFMMGYDSFSLAYRAKYPDSEIEPEEE